MLLSEKIFAVIIFFVIVNEAIASISESELFAILTLAGVLLARELSNSVASRMMKNRLDVFIWALSIVFVVEATGHIWHILP